MKHTIATAFLIAILPLSMAACSPFKSGNPTSSPSSSSAPSQESTSTPMQASPSASSPSKSSQTKEEACAILDDKANAISSSLNDKDPVELHRHHEVRRDHQPRSQVGGKWPGAQYTEAPRRDQGSRRSADLRAARPDSVSDNRVPGFNEQPSVGVHR